MIYIGIGILLATSVAAGLLLWQGRSLQAEVNATPCPSSNSPVQNSAGVLLDGVSICPGKDWKKLRHGYDLEKAAPTVAVTGAVFGLVVISLGAIIFSRNRLRNKGSHIGVKKIK